MEEIKYIRFIFTDDSFYDVLTKDKIVDSLDIEFVKRIRPYKAIKSILIPDGIEIIDTGTFRGQHSLTSVSLPQSIKIIKSKAFAFCRYLREINFPSGLECIEDGAFINTGLRDITLSNDCKIYNNLIYDCLDLERITIGDETFKRSPVTVSNRDQYKIPPFSTKEEFIEFLKEVMYVKS